MLKLIFTFLKEIFNKNINQRPTHIQFDPEFLYINIIKYQIIDKTALSKLVPCKYCGCALLVKKEQRYSEHHCEKCYTHYIQEFCL